jgi:hypothetical protein
VEPAGRAGRHGFAVGHSLTLIASALGWAAAPSIPVEVLIAASMAVSAVHGMRPLARHGEELGARDRRVRQPLPVPAQ